MLAGPAAIKSKKRKGKKKRKQKLAAMKHIPDIFTQFSKLGLKPPLDRDSVGTSLQALADKKKYYETAPPPAKKKKKEAAPAAAAKSGAADKRASNAAAGEEGEEIDEARLEQLKKERQEAEAEEIKMRNQNRRASLALLQAEQKRRIDELAVWQAASEAETAQARREAIAKAKKMMSDEQVQCTVYSLQSMARARGSPAARLEPSRRLRMPASHSSWSARCELLAPCWGRLLTQAAA